MAQYLNGKFYWADKLTHNIYTQKNKHKHTAKQR